MENAEKERIQNLPFRFVPTRSVIENSKTIAKKFKKLKNTTMASFQAKIGWKMPGKGENKNTVMALSHPFRPKQVGKRREREKKKIVVPLHSYTTRN